MKSASRASMLSTEASGGGGAGDPGESTPGSRSGTDLVGILNKKDAASHVSAASAAEVTINAAWTCGLKATQWKL